MDPIIVCVVQQKMRLPADLADFEQDLRRFLRVAQAKGAQLIVFPELTGMMAAPPLLDGLRAGLLKQADKGRQSRASLLERTRSKLASGAANLLGSDFKRELGRLLNANGASLWESYADLFGRLAQEANATIVAGSLYIADPVGGEIHNIASVFGPDGAMLGQQARIVMAGESADLATAGRGWGIITAPVGRLGLLLGADVLYPEVGRLLAGQGADFFISLGACGEPALYHQMRAGLLARVQENQLYGAISFAIGHNPFTPGDTQPFVGRSAICAPLEFTHRYTGVMAEVGADSTEGVISAIWDFGALQQLWEKSAVPMRQTAALEGAAPALRAAFDAYRVANAVPALPLPDAMPQLLAPAEASPALALPAPTAPSAAPPITSDDRADPDVILSLDDLPVVAVSEAPLTPPAGLDDPSALAADATSRPRRWPWQR